MPRHWLFTTVLTALAAIGPAHGQTAADLGTNRFTPIGADPRPSNDGEIPSWTGGLASTPAGISGVVRGRTYPDPFAADKPIVQITPANADQYRAKLTDGQYEQLKRIPGFAMNIYPSRRSCAYPRAVYDWTRNNVGHASLTPSGNGLVGAQGSFPFPFPKRPEEYIWNHKAGFYGGPAFQTLYSGFLVNTDGSFDETRSREEPIFPEMFAPPDRGGFGNTLLDTKVTTLAPARRRGNVLMVHQPLDNDTDNQEGFLYLPALRRTLRGPDVEFDAPDQDSQGLLTIDQRNMFTGSLARYNWRYIGKQVKYVGYNGYKIVGLTDHAKAVDRNHIKTEYMRYEPHRVYVVEARLKPGARHIYARRVFYIDEDSWYILAADMYDAQGRLWRTAETQLINFYDIPSCLPGVRIDYDLLDSRYYVELWSESYNYEVPAQLSPAFYSPDVLRANQR